MTEAIAVHAKRTCQFHGGIEVEEKYRAASLCLGEFLPNSPNQKNCENCRDAAKKWHNAQAASAAYTADPEKFAKITRENRWKRRKARGLPCPRLGITVPCKYRDKHGRRGEGCLRKFKRKSSFQKFCAVCQKHADADRARAFRDAHPKEEKARQTLRWKIVRQELAALSELRAGANTPRPSPRRRGRPTQETTKARIQIAAHLELDGLKRYGQMTDRLFPAPPGASDRQKTASRKHRFHNLDTFLRKYRKQIDVEKQRLAGVFDAEPGAAVS